MLRQYPGYTLSTLRAESAELMQLEKIEALGYGDRGGDVE